MGASAPSLDTPLVLVGLEGRRRVVVAADQAARRAGLSVGMPATKAQALVHGLVIHDADPEADRAALQKLAVWMQRNYSPLVSVYERDDLVLDITGVAHLFDGEAAMLKEVVRKLAAAGSGARIAAAPCYGAAYALARYVANPIYQVEEDKIAAALDLLLVSGLRLPAQVVAQLKRLGFERIGEPWAAKTGTDS